MQALVLTQERADALGFAGMGPFTFGGAFPGVYLVGRPLALNYLGFTDEFEAAQAFADAFDGVDESQIPLELTDVGEGEGLPLLHNHALSEGDPELGAAEVDAAAEKADVHSISTHADADALAAELGITFPAGTKLDEKRVAIEAFRAGASATGDPSHLTPAPGAEDSVPHGPEEPA